MSIEQELRDAIKPGQYIVVELEGVEAGQYCGQYYEITGFFPCVLMREENERKLITIPVLSINSVMDDNATTLWPKDAE